MDCGCGRAYSRWRLLLPDAVRGLSSGLRIDRRADVIPTARTMADALTCRTCDVHEGDLTDSEAAFRAGMC